MNKEKMLTAVKKYQSKDPELKRQRYTQYRLKSKDKLNRKQRERMAKDPAYKLIRYMRTRFWHALKGNAKSQHSKDILGCSIEEWKNHIQSKFKDGMTWENYGKWHVDHIIPCSSFDMSIPEQQVKCFQFSNTQPLWSEENLAKSNKI